MNKLVVGYTCGVFDLFHIGHLNLLRCAKGMCDKLIVGVSTDEVVKYKNKTPVIPYEERAEIVRCVKFVDVVIPQKNLDKFEAWEKLHYDILFVGDDWYDSPKWNDLEQKLKKVGVKIVYFPYTKHISSTLLCKTIAEGGN